MIKNSVFGATFTPTRVLDLLKKIDVRVVASDKFTNNSTKTCVIEKASLAKLEGYDFSTISIIVLKLVISLSHSLTFLI